jgi:ectoine hydroxylase-related dioxygenase (phytanoyl-CoA dioxygenase family)
MLKAVKFSEQERQNQQLDESSIAMVLKDFRQDGFVVLKDVFSKEYIQLLHKYFLNQYDRYFTDQDHHDALRVSNKRFQISIEVAGPFNSLQLYANPFVFPIMEQLFNYDFIISDLTCVTSLPGAKKMVAHADGRIFERHPIANLLPPHAVGVLIPLIPFTLINGPTRVWPGSQRMGPYFEDVADKSNFVDIDIDTGSCILMDYTGFSIAEILIFQNKSGLCCTSTTVSIWYYDPAQFQEAGPFDCEQC